MRREETLEELEGDARSPHKAQVLSYLRLLNVPVGLLINFYLQRVTDGVHRLILQGADGRDEWKPIQAQ